MVPHHPPRKPSSHLIIPHKVMKQHRHLPTITHPQKTIDPQINSLSIYINPHISHTIICRDGILFSIVTMFGQFPRRWVELYLFSSFGLNHDHTMPLQHSGDMPTLPGKLLVTPEIHTALLSHLPHFSPLLFLFQFTLSLPISFKLLIMTTLQMRLY